MWLLVVVSAVSVLVVVVTRGSWRALAHLPVQGAFLFFVGVLLQGTLEIVSFPRDAIEATGFALLMLSYVFLLAFCLVNLPLRGMGTIAVGVGLNALVIGLNVGMPTRPVGLDAQGHRVEKPIEHTVKHRPESPDDLLGFLGDKILLPRPFDALISLGDIVLLVGVAELVCCSSHRRRRSRQQGGRAVRRSTMASRGTSIRTYHVADDAVR